MWDRRQTRDRSRVAQKQERFTTSQKGAKYFAIDGSFSSIFGWPFSNPSPRWPRDEPGSASLSLPKTNRHENAKSNHTAFHPRGSAPGHVKGTRKVRRAALEKSDTFQRVENGSGPGISSPEGWKRVGRNYTDFGVSAARIHWGFCKPPP
jgi:hypothetical protein